MCKKGKTKEYIPHHTTLGHFSSDNNTCPPGWFPSDQEYCISLNNEGSASWLNSQTVCSYSRANLASITSEEEYQLIYGKNMNFVNLFIIENVDIDFHIL